jgi:hypothetical protein
MKSKTPPRKRGQLSLEEEQYIRDHVAILPVQQIADNLNRTIKPVERYISESKIGLKNYMQRPFG